MNIEDMDYLDNKDAAEYLGYSPITMKQSRSNGRLDGRIAPPHQKRRNKTIYYLRSDLDDWLEEDPKTLIPDIPQASNTQPESEKTRQQALTDLAKKISAKCLEVREREGIIIEMQQELLGEVNDRIRDILER
jgi:hypothetical protein